MSISNMAHDLTSECYQRDRREVDLHLHQRFSACSELRGDDEDDDNRYPEDTRRAHPQRRGN